MVTFTLLFYLHAQMYKNAGNVFKFCCNIIICQSRKNCVAYSIILWKRRDTTKTSFVYYKSTQMIFYHRYLLNAHDSNKVWLLLILLYFNTITAFTMESIRLVSELNILLLSKKMVWKLGSTRNLDCHIILYWQCGSESILQ